MTEKKLSRKEVIREVQSRSGLAVGEAFISHIRTDRERVPLELIEPLVRSLGLKTKEADYYVTEIARAYLPENLHQIFRTPLADLRGEKIKQANYKMNWEIFEEAASSRDGKSSSLVSVMNSMPNGIATIFKEMVALYDLSDHRSLSDVRKRHQQLLETHEPNHRLLLNFGLIGTGYFKRQKIHLGKPYRTLVNEHASSIDFSSSTKLVESSLVESAIRQSEENTYDPVNLILYPDPDLAYDAALHLAVGGLPTLLLSRFEEPQKFASHTNYIRHLRASYAKREISKETSFKVFVEEYQSDHPHEFAELSLLELTMVDLINKSTAAASNRAEIDFRDAQSRVYHHVSDYAERIVERFSAKPGIESFKQALIKRMLTPKHTITGIVVGRWILDTLELTPQLEELFRSGNYKGLRESLSMQQRIDLDESEKAYAYAEPCVKPLCSSLGAWIDKQPPLHEKRAHV